MKDLIIHIHKQGIDPLGNTIISGLYGIFKTKDGFSPERIQIDNNHKSLNDQDFCAINKNNIADIISFIGGNRIVFFSEYEKNAFIDAISQTGYSETSIRSIRSLDLMSVAKAKGVRYARTLHDLSRELNIHHENKHTYDLNNQVEILGKIYESLGITPPHTRDELRITPEDRILISATSPEIYQNRKGKSLEALKKLQEEWSSYIPEIKSKNSNRIPINIAPVNYDLVESIIGEAIHIHESERLSGKSKIRLEDIRDTLSSIQTIIIAAIGGITAIIITLRTAITELSQLIATIPN